MLGQPFACMRFWVGWSSPPLAGVGPLFCPFPPALRGRVVVWCGGECCGWRWFFFLLCLWWLCLLPVHFVGAAKFRCAVHDSSPQLGSKSYCQLKLLGVCCFLCLASPGASILVTEVPEVWCGVGLSASCCLQVRMSFY